MNLDSMDVMSLVQSSFCRKGTPSMWHVARGSSVSEAAKKQVAGSCCKHVQAVADSVLLCFWNQNPSSKDQESSHRLFLEHILPFFKDI